MSIFFNKYLNNINTKNKIKILENTSNINKISDTDLTIYIVTETENRFNIIYSHVSIILYETLKYLIYKFNNFFNCDNKNNKNNKDIYSPVEIEEPNKDLYIIKEPYDLQKKNNGINLQDYLLFYKKLAKYDKSKSNSLTNLKNDFLSLIKFGNKIVLVNDIYIGSEFIKIIETLKILNIELDFDYNQIILYQKNIILKKIYDISKNLEDFYTVELKKKFLDDLNKEFLEIKGQKFYKYGISKLSIPYKEFELTDKINIKNNGTVKISNSMVKKIFGGEKENENNLTNTENLNNNNDNKNNKNNIKNMKNMKTLNKFKYKNINNGYLANNNNVFNSGIIDYDDEGDYIYKSKITQNDNKINFKERENFLLKDIQNVRKNSIYISNNSGYHFISITSTIDNLYDTHIVSFDLFRIKINLELPNVKIRDITNLNNTKCSTSNEMNINMSIPSEFLDVSIPKFHDSTLVKFRKKYKLENFNETFTLLKFSIDNINCSNIITFNLKNLVYDLNNVFLKQNTLLPWTDSKYDKRLNRFCYLSILYLITQEDKIVSIKLIRSMINFLNNIQKYFENKGNIQSLVKKIFDYIIFHTCNNEGGILLNEYIYKNFSKSNIYLKFKSVSDNFTNIYSDLLEFIFINIYSIITKYDLEIFIEHKLNNSNLSFLNDTYKNHYINELYEIDFKEFIKLLYKWMKYWYEELIDFKNNNIRYEELIDFKNNNIRIKINNLHFDNIIINI